MKAHQRIIRDSLAESDPRPIAHSLSGYSVETISRLDAQRLIRQYEWLGTVGKATLFVGLLNPKRELEGVACFGHGPSGNVRGIIGAPALCLERGACVHFAPKNAASFLINAACKLVFRIHGVAVFFAYADPMAGEYGGVYQASGWIYVGQGLDGKKNRKRRYMVLPPGLDPDDPGNWKTTRELRRIGRRMTFASAKEAGWQIASREAKHLYATHVGRERKRWRRSVMQQPYPAPNPSLKIKATPSHARQFIPAVPPVSMRLTKPVAPQIGLFSDV